MAKLQSAKNCLGHMVSMQKTIIQTDPCSLSYEPKREGLVCPKPNCHVFISSQISPFELLFFVCMSLQIFFSPFKGAESNFSTPCGKFCPDATLGTPSIQSQTQAQLDDISSPRKCGMQQKIYSGQFSTHKASKPYIEDDNHNAICRHQGCQRTWQT